MCDRRSHLVPVGSASNMGGGRSASRKTRVYYFRDFLEETYIQPGYLRAGDVVLDVAGGQGDLSWLLTNCKNSSSSNNSDGIISVILDPARRSKQHRHLIKSVQYLRDHPEEAQKRAYPLASEGLMGDYQPLARLVVDDRLPTAANEYATPHHFPIYVDELFVQAVALSLQKTTTTSQNNHDGAASDFFDYWRRRQNESSSDDESTRKVAQHAWELIRACKLVVGFHPDQATDYCLQLAQALDVPVCIVPCCVFPKEFPHRRLPPGNTGDNGDKSSGDVVRTYAQLIEYLQGQMSGIRTAKLQFPFTETARNIVLYTLP